MARFTVYLPDELRERALAGGLNLSAILRRGVIAELREVAELGVDEEGTPAPSSSN